MQWKQEYNLYNLCISCLCIYFIYSLCSRDTVGRGGRGGGDVFLLYSSHETLQKIAARQLKTCAQIESLSRKKANTTYRIHLTFIFICFMLVHSQKISQQKDHYFDEEKKHKYFYTSQLLVRYTTKFSHKACAAVCLCCYRNILAISCFIFMISHNLAKTQAV